MSFNTKFLIVLLVILFQNRVLATDYFVHPTLGNDTNNGLSKEQAFKTLSKASTIVFQSGDRLLLASGQHYQTGLQLINLNGTKDNPIIISTINWNTAENITPATIDFKGETYGILIQDCSYIEISKIALTANGFFSADATLDMRCGIMVTNKNVPVIKHIRIKEVNIFDVFYENPGFKRGIEEVKTANGTQKYGWGIRIINKSPNTLIEDIEIKNCTVNSVSHTGIKLTGKSKNISSIIIEGNTIERTGGPGIQMSEVKNVHVYKNNVSHSGSDDDSRKWGRGSGLWTWGSSHILIEKNKFLYANGPGDSAGAHIDFNCDNVVLQYNISAYNAGGFCEILGNNYNCAYRYNISINDGHRVKGVNGAFQEGKIFWLSGYQGEQQKRKGPVNSYFYNNTIYSDASIVAKIAIDNTSNGILIANNIFYLEGPSKAVLGDQYKPDKQTGDLAKNVFFKNNLFLNKTNWPQEIGIKDASPIFGNPGFAKKGGMEATDYIPENTSLILNKGIAISLLPNDSVGLLQSLDPKKDILGNPIEGIPSLGAIEPKVN